MQNLLAKSAVIALLAGGFAFTGDAGRFFSRGKGILDATTVPTHDRGTDARPEGGAPSSPTPVERQAEPAVPAQAPAPPPPPEPAAEQGSSAPRVTAASSPPPDAPVGSPVVVAPLPADGPSRVAIDALAPGDRIVVWIGRGAGRGRIESVAFDLVDVASGDAVELRHGPAGDDAARFSPRRRVRLAGAVRDGLLGSGPPEPRTIVRGRSLRLEMPDVHGTGRATVETIGPVAAIDIVRTPAAGP